MKKKETQNAKISEAFKIWRAHNFSLFQILRVSKFKKFSNLDALNFEHFKFKML